jgi:hypothetical protein
MQISMLERGHARHVYSVVLEGDESNWTDFRIITATDRRGELTDAEWTDIETGKQHPCHFGGDVSRSSYDPNLVTVTVYVD